MKIYDFCILMVIKWTFAYEVALQSLCIKSIFEEVIRSWCRFETSNDVFCLNFSLNFDRKKVLKEWPWLELELIDWVQLSFHKHVRRNLVDSLPIIFRTCQELLEAFLQQLNAWNEIKQLIFRLKEIKQISVLVRLRVLIYFNCV